MTARLALSIDNDDRDPSVTVTEAANELGCDDSTVRAMLRKRQLAGHYVGKGEKPGGVRVSWRSVKAYKVRHTIGDDDQPEALPPRRTRSMRHAADLEADARLKALGA